MRASRIALSLIVFSFMASPALAADRYTFDTAHTQILFFVSHLGFSQSQGEFLDYDGHFTFESDDWSNSEVNVDIKTASVDMDLADWDEHLRSEDFFHVTEYPTMSFTSREVEKTGEQTGTIHGDLTLLGTTQPVTLDVTFNKAGKHPISGKYVAGFSAETVIDRTAYGMDYGAGMIGNDVTVRLEVEGFRQ